MRKRLRTDLEDWEIELLKAAQTNIQHWQDLIDHICAGGRVVDDDLGDITEDENRKAVWYVATYRSRLAKLELDYANDNNVYADEELTDLIMGDW
jgi:hypothetical protein